MAMITCAECGKTFSDKASSCPHCGCPIEFVNKLHEGAIKTAEEKRVMTSPKVLREYLENVRALETDVYTMTTAIDNLTAQIKPEPTKKTFTVPIKPKEFIEENAAKEGWKELTFWGIQMVLPHAVLFAIEKNIDTRRRNKEGRSKYESDMAIYQNKMMEYERAVHAEKWRYANEYAQVTLFNEGINKQIETLTAEKNATEAALRRLYDINVIYPKYHGIVPVTMFCEYMDSGRRTELVGVHGMYDLYETELMGKQIVNSLSKINDTLSYISYQVGGIASQLTGIQRNQILLHEEIARSNEIASQINQSTSKMLEQSASMATAMSDMNREISSLRSTAEMTAFTTAATARRVDAIAKIEEHEYALRHPNFPSV